MYKSNRTVLIGYIVIVSLVLGIGLIAVIQLRQIKRTVDNVTNSLAQEIKLTNDVLHQVLETRIFANRYIRTLDQVDLDRYFDEYEILEDLLVRAETEVLDQRRVDLVAKIRTFVDDYGRAYQNVVAIIQKRQSLHSEILNAQDVIILSKLSALRVHTISENNPGMILAFDNAQYHYQLMKYFTLAYLQEGDESFAVQFDTAHQSFLSALAHLDNEITDFHQSQNVSELEIAVTEYSSGFDILHSDYRQMTQIFEMELNVLEPAIIAAAQEMVQLIEGEYQNKNEYAQKLISATRAVLAIISFVAIFTGVGLGIVVRRRTIEALRAEEALRDHQNKLEELIETRTAELQAANQQLQTEVHQRERMANNLEETVAELQKTNSQIERFNRMFIGREKRMVELKIQINQLSEELDRERPYDVSFVGEMKDE